MRFNALKHGLLAQLVVIDDGNGEEDRTLYEQLLAGLANDYEPVGVLEELLVQEVANCYWRLRRVLRHEVGVLREDLDDCMWNAAGEGSRQRNAPGSEHRMFADFAKAFEELTDQLSGDSDLSAEMVEAINTVLSPRYDEQMPHVLTYLQLWRQSKRESAAQVPSSVSPAQLKLERKKAAEDAFSQVVVFKVCERVERQVEYHKASAKLNSLQIPGPEKVTNLVRYETAIHRQLYRAMDQLERRQRLRKGEFVPPPVKLVLERET